MAAASQKFQMAQHKIGELTKENLREWMSWAVSVCALNKVHQNYLKDISFHKLQLFLKHPSLPEELEPVLSAIRELCQSDR